MLYKAIIQGKIEYGTEKSFKQAVKMYDYRAENYHKSDTLFLIEEIFDEENLAMVIPRYVKQVFEKTYRNTIALIDYCTQFGLSGEINAWLIDDGTVLKYDHMEPNSDKIAVQRFLKGKSLSGTEGNEEQALEQFTKAIEKYDKHAQAYQRRAKVNRILRRYHDALRDYNKSINLDDTNPHAFYGRAKIHMIQENKELAIPDFENCLKLSVALQPVYWKARHWKGICHFELEQYDKAAFDFKLFVNRKFEDSNPNLRWVRKVHFYYGETLAGLEQYQEAIEQYTLALEKPLSPEPIAEATVLTQRGQARFKAGINGYLADWAAAEKLGDKFAGRLLKENS